MKKLFLIFFILISSISFGQQKTDGPEEIYKPFLDTNKMWIESSSFQTSTEFGSESKTEVFQLVKENDSIYSVRSQLIRHFYYVGFESSNVPGTPYYNWEGLTELSTPIAFLQETDSVIFKFNEQFENRQLLYDFREKPFDTTTVYVNVVRDAIYDSTEIHLLDDLSSSRDIYLHTINNDCYMTCDEMIFSNNGENVSYRINNRLGSYNSLLTPFGYCSVKSFDASNCLECYLEKNIPLFTNSNRCQEYIERIENGVTQNISESSISTFNIYPNPTSSTLNFSGEIKFQSYKIVDMQGKIFDSGQISNDHLDVTNLKQGLYYLIIETENGLLSKKFTKI